MGTRVLLAVPNVSEGADVAKLARLAAAFAAPAQPPAAAGSAPVRVLDVHSDADHNRSVFTLAGPPGALAGAVMNGAAVAVSDVAVVAGDTEPAGQHPHVGALDVAPIVYLSDADRGAACAEALVLADRIGHELEVPVFLYGELTEDDHSAARTRAQLRRGGVAKLAARMADREHPLAPDFGPAQPHPTAGACLVAARAPLVAFNIQLAPPATLDDARALAGEIREGAAGGLPGVRAIAVLLRGSVPQVSTNVERPFELPLVEVLEAVRRRASVSSAEIVGLVPAAALAGFPEDVPLSGFDPQRHLLENALRS